MLNIQYFIHQQRNLYKIAQIKIKKYMLCHEIMHTLTNQILGEVVHIDSLPSYYAKEEKNS